MKKACVILWLTEQATIQVNVLTNIHTDSVSSSYLKCCVTSLFYEYTGNYYVVSLNAISECHVQLFTFVRLLLCLIVPRNVKLYTFIFAYGNT